MPPRAKSTSRAKAKAKAAETEAPSAPEEAEAPQEKPEAAAKVGAKAKAKAKAKATEDAGTSEEVPDAKAGAKAKAKGKAKAADPIVDAGPLEETLEPKGKAKAKGKAKGKGKGKAKDKEAEEDDMEDLEAAIAAAEEEKKKAEELAKSDAFKQWIKFVGPDGEECKLLLSLKSDVKGVRREICRAAGVPSMQLVMEIKGQEVVQAYESAFRNFDIDNDVIRWWKGDRLQKLLDKRLLPTINNLDKFERSAVHFAVIDGDFEMCELIVDHMDFKHQLINKQDIFGDTALHLSCILGYTDIVELMLDKQCLPEIQNIYRRNAMMLASEHGHAQSVRALLRSGAKMGPNAGKHDWKYPTPEWLAKHNYRNKTLREIDQARVEQKIMAEIESGLFE